MAVMADGVHPLSDRIGSVTDCPNPDARCKPVRPDRSQRSRCETAALRAVRIAAELARRYLLLQICGYAARRHGKVTLARIPRRVQVHLQHASRQLELVKFLSQDEQFIDDGAADPRRKDFVACLTLLRRI